MNKKTIGFVIKGLIQEANLSTEQVANLLGKSKQSVYNDYNRVGMKDDEIGRYAKALGIEKDVIYVRLGSDTETPSIDYLQQHLKNLEEQFKALADQLQQQLAIKDKQIEGYQRTVDVLLGKYEVSENVTCSDEEEYEPEHVLNSLQTDMVA
jgi:uncharacterized protein YecE (DUF72 family)